MCELLLQGSTIGWAEVPLRQSFPEEIGQRSAPIGVVADDPIGRRAKASVSRIQKWDDLRRLQITGVHLVESDESGAELLRVGSAARCGVRVVPALEHLTQRH